LFGKDPSQLDELHCVAKHNRAAKLFNLQLHALCTKLRGEFAGASITYVDIHTIKYSLIANYSRFGMQHKLPFCVIVMHPNHSRFVGILQHYEKISRVLGMLQREVL